MLTEEQLRRNFAVRLTAYRKLAGLTQLELAEKLNYSDKSVSKWERGDGLPDFYVILQLAELFSVSVEDLIAEGVPRRPLLSRNKALTTLLAMGLPWLVAVILFVILRITVPAFRAWLFFVYAVPVTAIVSIVFTMLWWKRWLTFISVSALIWTVPTCLVVTVSVPQIALIYCIAAALQILTVLWFLRKK